MTEHDPGVPELEDDPGPVPDELSAERDSYSAECGSSVHPESWTRIRHIESHSDLAELRERIEAIQYRLAAIDLSLGGAIDAISVLDERTGSL